MKDVHAYMGSGDLCAEVHLSKVFFQSEDQKLFDEVLASIRFLPDEKPRGDRTAALSQFTLKQSDALLLAPASARC